MENKATQQIDVNFSMLFQAMPGLLVVLSPELDILAANDSYLETIGKTRHQLIGKNLFQVFPSENSYADNDSDALLQSLQQVIITHLPHTIPANRYDLPSPNSKENGSSKKYWSLVNTPVLNQEGELLYIIHEVRNITHQVEEEEQVKTSYDSLRLMANIVGGAVWEYDVLNRKFTWSESYKDLFGYSSADLEVTHSDWSLRVHPDDVNQVRKAIERAIEVQGKSWAEEYRYLRADGSYADVLDHGYILYDVAGSPVRMLGSMIDLSTQKEYERELQESNERFELVVKATNDVIWDWNMLDDSLWWNEGIETLFGYGADQVSTIDTWINHIHPFDLEKTNRSFQQAITNGPDSWEAAYRFLCKDGSYKLVHDKGYIVRDKEGQAIRMIGAMKDITEKHEIERQLQESNARTKQILSSLPLMPWTSNTDGSVIDFSQAWYDYTGASPDELQTWWLRDQLHPDDRERTTEIWGHSLRTGEPFETENRWKSKEGVYRWFLARAVPIRNSVGNITMWVGSHTDIEDQKQLLLSVQESNRRTQFLAETIPQIVWIANPEGGVDYFNQRWYEYTRMTETETLGWGWEPAIHPDDLQFTMDHWKQSIQTGEKYEIELRLRNVYTDDYRWFLARSLPMRNDAGEIVKWFGTATDIHDFKLLHQQVKESNKKFQFLAETIPQMVWTTNADGYVDYFNQRWMDYTHLTLQESLGGTWSNVLHPDDRQGALDRWEHSLKSGVYYEVEYRIRNGADGVYRWFLAQAMPMRTKKGKIIKWFGTCTDIEDHKRAEEELVEKNLELERINHDLDSFVYTASHDLKLPIVNMAGIFGELMASAEFRDPDAPVMIQMFNKSLRQLHETIHDLSEVVRVQKQKDSELIPVNLCELIDDIGVGLQDVLNETGAQIQANFNEVPAIPFTRANLRSILYNLITNAIKYRSADRTPEIQLTTQYKGNFIELKVEDNGIGIDMNKHQNKLFQMFKRFHNHVAGSGLGLYIVNRLLTNQGGYIQIESTLDKGTTFYLYFKDVNNK